MRNGIALTKQPSLQLAPVPKPSGGPSLLRRGPSMLQGSTANPCKKHILDSESDEDSAGFIEEDESASSSVAAAAAGGVMPHRASRWDEVLNVPAAEGGAPGKRRLLKTSELQKRKRSDNSGSGDRLLLSEDDEEEDDNEDDDGIAPEA